MADIETRVTMLEQQVSNVMTKLDMFIAESREARKRQDADIREIRQEMKDMQKNMDTKIDGMGKHVRNLTVAAMVGIGAAVIGIAAMVVAVFLK